MGFTADASCVRRFVSLSGQSKRAFTEAAYSGARYLELIASCKPRAGDRVDRLGHGRSVHSIVWTALMVLIVAFRLCGRQCQRYGRRWFFTISIGRT